VFVLVHSPAVGPATWAPVASALRARGRDAVVPSLTGLAEAEPPYWVHVVRTVVAAIDRAGGQDPLVVVAHSGAGLFVPLLVANAPRAVRACVFVDATVPVAEGYMPVAPPALLPFLRARAEHGRLPAWTQWWEPGEAAVLFPDEHTRALVEAEEPRLPLAYYEEAVPAPPGWDDRPCGYVLFSETYAAAAEQARMRGWAVEHLPGGHLHQLTDPVGVAQRLLALTEALVPDP
jgi:pimeloyl-ACP methyl ester carboxylesterase